MQRLRAQLHRGRAVAALDGARVHEGLLHGVQGVGRAQPLRRSRRAVPPRAGPGVRHETDGPPVEQHRAGAALAGLAAVLHAAQPRRRSSRRGAWCAPPRPGGLRRSPVRSHLDHDRSEGSADGARRSERGAAAACRLGLDRRARLGDRALAAHAGRRTRVTSRPIAAGACASSRNCARRRSGPRHRSRSAASPVLRALHARLRLRNARAARWRGR